MRSLTMIAMMSGLLMGASRCDPRGTQPGGNHGGGSAGRGGEACGDVTCGRGEVCCNASCGICTKPGGACTQQACEPPTGGPCGPVDCAAGQECCNESCGICVEPGGVCTQQACEGERCGPTTCGVGQECCNQSCGICVDPGGACTEQFCEAGPFCGGIAAIRCAGAGQCVDDWRDDCDPNNGGADCGGVCTCSGAAVLCIEGTIFNDDPAVCACEPAEPPAKVFCGGIAGIQCPGAGMCVDDPSDDCDPNNGGADCGGMCDCSGISALCIAPLIFNNDPRVCACE